MFDEFVKFVREIYRSDNFIPLHEPRFIGNEKKYVINTIDSTFVSSVGSSVDQFEREIIEYTGAGYGISTVNGTSALHVALLLSDIQPGDEVVTQSLTFAATCAAICYCSGIPLFIDVDRDTMGMSPSCLQEFLENNCEVQDGNSINKKSGRIIRACLPMHTFGHPCKIDEIATICEKYSITLIEDAAESLGSRYNSRHTGRSGTLSVFSFNGNKIITTGGGGIVITDDNRLAEKAKHLTTTAKKAHPWAYEHDMIGYNYRMPNLNAALGCAQIEQLESFIESKREVARLYKQWCDMKNVEFFSEPVGAYSNYWLNTLFLEDEKERDSFLQYTNGKGVMTRPIWVPMHKLPMYRKCEHHNLKITDWLEKRAVNIPSSVMINV